MLGYFSSKYFLGSIGIIFLTVSIFFVGVKHGKKSEIEKAIAYQNQEKNRLLELIRKNISENAELNSKLIKDQQKYEVENANLSQRLNDEIKKNANNYTCRIDANLLQLRAESRDRANLFAASGLSNDILPAASSSER